MYRNCKVKLSKSTIYREIMDKVYLNEVRCHSLLTMENTASPLIEYLTCFRSFEELNGFVSSTYDDVENVQEYCNILLTQLNELGFLDVLGSMNNSGVSKADVKEANELVADKVLLEPEAIEKRHLLNVVVELTYNCNLKCKHCYIGDTKSKLLDTDFYFKLLDDLYDLGVLNIVFTGGEVFTRKDSVEIIRYAVQKNFIVDIFTNGTLIDMKIFEELCAININSIQCSLYSINESVHDNFVGQKGAFRKTVEIIKRFNEHDVLTAIKTCIFDFNVNEYKELEKLAEELGATFQHTIILLPRKNGDTTPMNYGLSEKNFRKYLADYGQSLYRERGDDQSICSAGFTSASINPVGKVFLCNSFDWEIGDLLQQDIKTIWYNSEKLKEWCGATMSMLIECENCMYINYCDFCPGIAYKLTGSPYKKYFSACKQANSIYDVLGKEEKGL